MENPITSNSTKISYWIDNGCPFKTPPPAHQALGFSVPVNYPPLPREAALCRRLALHSPDQPSPYASFNQLLG